MKTARRFEVDEMELFRDLLALDQESVSIEFDAKLKRLMFVTADVTLENHTLGAFKIVLHVDSLSTCPESRAYYEVVAIDANRPSTNDDVTHPHIQDDRLCEGDAQPAIKLALQQGRLLDFFQIVEQTLQTYNAASAYVSLDDWEGFHCRQCGFSASSDDRCACNECGTNVCDNCICGCSDCEHSVCGNCEVACEACGESVCKSCELTCSKCDERFCSDCFTENERCDSCEKKTDEETESGTANAAVFPDSVGEAAISA